MKHLNNKTIYLFAAVALAVVSITASAFSSSALRKKESSEKNCSQKKAESRTLEISFDYTHQNGHGSNQYAVWIENEEGEVVKTLFVTSFTTKGRKRNSDSPKPGYTFRPNCVPTWVSNAKVEQLSADEVDAVTGATPKDSGQQLFTWDFKDNQGNEISKGKLTVYIEATLYNDNIVLYKAQFDAADNNADLLFTTTRTGSDTSHNSMIANVRAVVK